MRTRLLLSLIPAASLAAAFLLNCGDADVCEGTQCGSQSDGGQDGSSDASLQNDGGQSSDGGSDGTAPPGCNTSADLSSQAACVADSVASFVDTTAGSDTVGNGTKEKPFKTIKRALATGPHSAVFICAGNYSETVTLTSPVSLYGGFTCAAGDWSYGGRSP